MNHSDYFLFSVLSFPEYRKIQCQYPGCGHSIFKEINLFIHRSTGAVLPVGSSCLRKMNPDFRKNLVERSKSRSLHPGIPLSQEMRDLYETNLAEFLRLARLELTKDALYRLQAARKVRQDKLARLEYERRQAEDLERRRQEEHQRFTSVNHVSPTRAGAHSFYRPAAAPDPSPFFTLFTPCPSCGKASWRWQYGTHFCNICNSRRP